ncbi:MAG: hypothetical protein JXA46_09445 [Dehalococcoidales bacterium]|nr:hypothetical protein [Dehalococcoidales bacterium]
MKGSYTGLPDNWAEMTPSQKRQYRFDNFINPKGITFVSPGAKEAYQTRAKRTVAAYNIEEFDRVPISLPVGELPYTLYGINYHTTMYDVEKAIKACNQFNEKHSAELEYFASPTSIPAKALDILDYKLYAWPGHGLSEDAPGYQCLEDEYMKADEYDALILDPSDYWLRTYLPRVFGTFDSLPSLPPLTDIVEIPVAQIAPLADPRVRNTLRKLIEAGEELERRAKLTAPYFGLAAANGFPMAMGGIAVVPFDVLGDTMRGTAAIMKDMYRRPDKLLAALDKIADITISSILNAPNFSSMLMMMFPLHKGADGWMSQKQYDTFYFPTMKKVLDALINEGIIPHMFAEGAYNTRLETVNAFPRGTVSWLFDQTDMLKAKKVLGDKCCISGNVPSSLLVTGSPEDVKECCRKLIEDCAAGGGYVLSAGCVPENPKLENLRAMIAAVKEYGIYKK